MVLGTIIYKFDIDQDEQGNILPKFQEIASKLTKDNTNLDLNEIVSVNDRFSLFFNHTTGLQIAKSASYTSNSIVGRLKDTPYQIISHFHKEIDDSKYLIITVFKLNEEMELYEGMISHMVESLNGHLRKRSQGNLKSLSFVSEIQNNMQKDIEFTIFQIDRLSNLSKIQKLALIFSTPERRKVLEILRNGPVEKTALYYELEKIKPNPKMDLILSPFVELNIIRRDWAKGELNKSLGTKRGEGEYLFLVKDVALIRMPPTEILEKMKTNELVGPQYLTQVEEFYKTYDPFKDQIKESTNLAGFLLEPDTFDFLALMRASAYPREKLPKVLSSFASLDTLLNQLYEAKIIIPLHGGDKEWCCMLSDIVPLVIFPEYLLPCIKERVKEAVTPLNQGSVNEPLTMEVADKGLELLKSTYEERDIEF